MKYAVQMGSGVMTYIPSFITTGSGIQKLIDGIQRYTDTHTAWRSHKPTFFLSFFLFQNRKVYSKLKISIIAWDRILIRRCHTVWENEDEFHWILNVNKYPLLRNVTKIIYFLVNFYRPSLTTVYKAIRWRFHSFISLPPQPFIYLLGSTAK
jgi:hypothetical protein